MERQDIFLQLRGIMKAGLPDVATDWDTVEESSAIVDLGIDSISLLDLIYDIQCGFELDFDAELLADIRTVGDLVGFLGTRLP